MWFVTFLVLVILSGLVDEYIRSIHIVDVPISVSILYFTINIVAVSTVIFGLFYYFIGSERKYRTSLEQNLENLKNAQNQLVESEKMSALGSLVAGVAHEVNTPLGISITAASIFKNEIEALKSAVEENSLSKSKLNNFIDNVIKTDELLINNLNRAAKLIKNFKKISVDQSRDDLRKFELNSYIREVISTIHNEIKHNNVSLDLDLQAQPIFMNTYPGAIAQIIINLIQNSLLHGFEAKEKGHIRLITKESNENVIIICEDDGRGVHKDVLHKIFEPFITTKRNKGGTGLGLNISYNLVTQHLKGSIKLDTTYQEGARFVMTMPKNN
ncbi:MAG TPA: HAMP domain-containing histidine kinase [Sulfurimonas sp.]|nr:HAMP domain-containing histidine kinase [Sulfurimonas sp.]